jgi:antitoxin component YwqK of YwqJK toxin-antitoxin module/peroxiredoxin
MASALRNGTPMASVASAADTRPPLLRARRSADPPSADRTMKTTTIVAVGLCLVAGTACKALVGSLIDFSEKWSSGMPKSRGALSDGLQSGEWTFYHESGKPRAKGGYKADRQVGPWTFFHENGVVARSGSYDDKGLRTGEWTEQYPDQTPQSRGRLVADFEDGPWQFFAADGSLEREGQFDKGQQSGPWTWYWPGGKVKARGMCFRGERIGPWRIVDAQGNERVQDFGSKAGVQLVRETSPAGSVRREGVLQNGAPVGRWTSYHDNGALRFCCTLNGTVASGVFEARDEDGNVLAQGLLDGGAFAAGSTAVEKGAMRGLAGPVPAPGGEAWAGTAALAALTPEAVVARFAADTASPVAPAAIVAKAQPTTTPPPPATAAVVAQIDAEPTRAPAPMQPDLSVKQRQEMASYVAEYTDGPKPGGAGSSLLSKYRTSSAPASAPKPQGTGELTQWYGQPLPFQKLKGVDGTELDLAQFTGKKKVMIVVLRGFLGEVCCYCVAQTKALAQSRERLEQLGIEVLVIYPGAKENEQSFEQAYKMTFNEGGPPYRVFYDPNLELVTQLGIEGDLASPSTLIVDKDGVIRFFYKGEHRADRPAAKKLIQVIEGLAQ